MIEPSPVKMGDSSRDHHDDTGAPGGIRMNYGGVAAFVDRELKDDNSQGLDDHSSST